MAQKLQFKHSKCTKPFPYKVSNKSLHHHICFGYHIMYIEAFLLYVCICVYLEDLLNVPRSNKEDFVIHLTESRSMTASKQNNKKKIDTTPE